MKIEKFKKMLCLYPIMAQAKFDKTVLKRFRELYFPAIKQGLTTGYNVYAEPLVVSAPLCVSYLHSDLGFLPDGRPHPHRQELYDKLVKFGPASISERTLDTVIERIALYELGDWDDNPAGLTFYDEDGTELSLDKLQNHRGKVIVEGKQYNLSVAVASEQDMMRVLDILEKFTYLTKTVNGRVIKQLNENAITDAWVIPLIMVNSETIPRQFSSIFEVCFTLNDYESRSLVVTPAKLSDYLVSKGIASKTISAIVNEPFVSSYLLGLQ